MKILCNIGDMEVILEPKNIKNINLRVLDDCTVHVSAPYNVPQEYLERFVKSREGFIADAKMRILQRTAEKSLLEPQEGRFILCTGQVRFLGKSYKLKIEPAENDSVTLSDETVTVCTYDAENKAYAERLLADWFYNSSVSLFKRMNEEIAAIFVEKYHIPPAKVEIKRMKSRWGSCHVHEKKITVNSRLIFYPEEAVSYVFVHEYSHFVVPDHSKAFYKTVQSVMPQYKKYSDMLR